MSKVYHHNKKSVSRIVVLGQKGKFKVKKWTMNQNEFVQLKCRTMGCEILLALKSDASIKVLESK